jgi:hypothetical protein
MANFRVREFRTFRARQYPDSRKPDKIVDWVRAAVQACDKMIRKRRRNAYGHGRIRKQ